jgi:hypothetical protein
MTEDQAPDVIKGKSGRKNILIVAVVAIVAIVIVAAAVFSGTGGSSNSDKVITKSNAEVVIVPSDLPDGWTTDIPYRLDPYNSAPNVTELGVARYTHNISVDPRKVEVVTLQIGRLNTTEQAKELYAVYRAEANHTWQSVELETIGNVSVGDEAILCSGNWTGSHGAIKTVVFRENNVIVILVYEATENVGLTNQAAIDMAKLQDQKILK